MAEMPAAKRRELALKEREVCALEQIAANGKSQRSTPGYREHWPPTVSESVRNFLRGPWGIWNV